MCGRRLQARGKQRGPSDRSEREASEGNLRAEAFLNKFIQWPKCRRIGYIRCLGSKPARGACCGEYREKNACVTENQRCSNSTKIHMSTSYRIPVHKESALCQYKTDHKLLYFSARTVVLREKKSTRDIPAGILDESWKGQDRFSCSTTSNRKNSIRTSSLHAALRPCR